VVAHLKVPKGNHGKIMGNHIEINGILILILIYIHNGIYTVNDITFNLFGLMILMRIYRNEWEIMGD
jgi:hypothetical protein